MDLENCKKIIINYRKYHNIGLFGENNVLVKKFNLLRVELVFYVRKRACLQLRNVYNVLVS